jgi:outer membrane protein assembly factor BamD (BamD/ComL family)
MKKFLPVVGCLLLAVLCAAVSVRAQGGAVKSGPDPATVRDPEQERDSIKNLEAAKLYFNMRKAYVASLARCEEIIAGDPNFSRIDEALWFAGMSNLYLSQGKGKQAPDPKITPDQYREEARRYFAQLVKDYPDSKFHKKAEEELSKLGGEKAAGSKQ